MRAYSSPSTWRGQYDVPSTFSPLSYLVDLPLPETAYTDTGSKTARQGRSRETARIVIDSGGLYLRWFIWEGTQGVNNSSLCYGRIIARVCAAQSVIIYT